MGYTADLVSFDCQATDCIENISVNDVTGTAVGPRVGSRGDMHLFLSFSKTTRVLCISSTGYYFILDYIIFIVFSFTFNVLIFLFGIKLFKVFRPNYIYASA